MSLSLFSAVDRPLIPAFGKSDRYLMLSIVASAGTVQRPPLNLALIVDRSGSMGGSKLSRAKKAASFVVGQLTENDRLSVVTYDDDVKVAVPSTRMTAVAKIDALRRISGIETGGSTNLSGGWLTGCQEVAKNQAGDTQVDRAILLTDGLANVGITRVEELIDHAEQLRKLGVTTSTLGLGVDFDEELLTAMARHGGGRFQFIENSKAIPDCIAGELGELMSFAARRAVIDLVLPAGVRVASNLNDDIVESTDTGARITLGDIQSGSTRPTLLALTIEPAVSLDGPLTISATLRAIDGGTGAGIGQEFPVVALRPATSDAVEAQPVDAEVNEAAIRLQGSTAREQAARKIRDGDIESAKRIIGSAIGTFAAAPASPASAEELRELEALQTEAADGLSASRIKEVQYQTYLRKSSRGRYDSQQ